MLLHSSTCSLFCISILKEKPRWKAFTTETEPPHHLQSDPSAAGDQRQMDVYLCQIKTRQKTISFYVRWFASSLRGLRFQRLHPAARFMSQDAASPADTVSASHVIVMTAFPVRTPASHRGGGGASHRLASSRNPLSAERAGEREKHWKRHSGTAGITVASQQEGSEFESEIINKDGQHDSSRKVKPPPLC